MEKETPVPTFYERVGGAERVRELVDRFYEHMDSLEEARGIRSLHPASLEGSRNKLYLFLSGWLGGPALYVEKYGHPRLRARHLPFPIGEAERDQWMTCMQRALADMSLETRLREELESHFWRMADHMRNRAEHAKDSGLRILHPRDE